MILGGPLRFRFRGLSANGGPGNAERSFELRARADDDIEALGAAAALGDCRLHEATLDEQVSGDVLTIDDLPEELQTPGLPSAPGPARLRLAITMPSPLRKVDLA